jgi:hypothetical protein
MIINYPRAVQCNNGFVYNITVGKQQNILQYYIVMLLTD